MERQRYLDPNPKFSSDTAVSSQMNEPFVWLAMHVVDSLTIDGHRLVAVDHVEHQQDGTMRVACSSESGTLHLFEFNVLEDGPVLHSLVENPELS